MYIILNKTRQTKEEVSGPWPKEHLEKLLNRGDRIIVYSLYSNVIKVPYHNECHGVSEWEWLNFEWIKQRSD
jgi:hypothetical protein